MATEKVGVYRKYHGPVPQDQSGQPLPKSEWPKKRAFRWAVRWFGHDGKRYSRSFKTRKEAERFAENRQSDVRSQKPDPPVSIHLRDFAREHSELMREQISYNTLREQERALRYLVEIVGNRPLAKVTPRHAEVFVQKRSETGVSVSTINKEIMALRRIFALAAERRDYLPQEQNPFKKIPRRKVTRTSLRYVTSAEFSKLLESSPNLKWKTFLSLLYTTGLRFSEATNLIWTDIDLELGVLQVSAKRNSDSLVPWEPKDHELRHIPLCKEMVEILERWQLEAPKHVPYVFLTAQRYSCVMRQVRKGTWRSGRILINNVPRDFGLIRERAEVPHCTLHDFRRSCITNWASRLPAHVVRELAGHSSLETTVKYYLIVQALDLDNARTVTSGFLAHAGAHRCASWARDLG